MLDKLLRLTPWKFFFVLVAWVLCVLLHNALYALLRDSFAPGWDEPFFLILAVIVIPSYFFVAVIYTAIRAVRKRV